MVETDSPFLAPMPHRGKRCEPAFVRHTAERIAEVKGCSIEALSEATCAAAEGFYRFDR
jgi:TatD DNase family protein